MIKWIELEFFVRRMTKSQCGHLSFNTASDLPLDSLRWWFPPWPLPCLNANNLAPPRWFFTISVGRIVNSIGSCLPGHQQLLFVVEDGRSAYVLSLVQMISCVVYHTSLYLCIHLVGCAFSSKPGFVKCKKHVTKKKDFFFPPPPEGTLNVLRGPWHSWHLWPRWGYCTLWSPLSYQSRGLRI